MSQPKFTPGPWIIVPRIEHGPTIARLHNSRLTKIAITNEKNENVAANAHLIAAAPEIYGALEKAYLQIIEFLNEGNFNREVVFDAGYIVDALAKARGEQ